MFGDGVAEIVAKGGVEGRRNRDDGADFSAGNDCESGTEVTGKIGGGG